PTARRAVLRPHLEGLAAGDRPVRLRHVPAEPGLLAVGEVAAADALEEVAGTDESAGFDCCGDESGEGAVGEGAVGGCGGVEGVAAGAGGGGHLDSLTLSC